MRKPLWVAFNFSSLSFALGAFFAVPTTAIAQEENTLSYGSRGGMKVSIVSRAGIGTSKAVIGIRHTRANALSYCEGYELTSSKECVERTLNGIKVRKQVTANCKSGKFTDVWGQAFQFKGRSKGGDPEYTIIEAATGSPLDGSSASDYSSRLSTFEALCPNRL